VTTPIEPAEVEPAAGPARTRWMDKTRTEAFSDGVFAIAITLLVLEVRVPTPEQVDRYGGLLQALLHGWASYLSYLATFLTVGVIWLNHHAGFLRIARIDRTVQWWNLMLLLAVSFTPFPNALLTEYLPAGLFSEPARTAAAVYALVFALSTVPWVFLWGHLAARPELLAPGVDAHYARRRRTRSIFGVGVYAVCVAVAVVAPVLALVLFCGAAAFYAFTTGGPPDAD
jgi:uncharacterized membrane protein